MGKRKLEDYYTEELYHLSSFENGIINLIHSIRSRKRLLKQRIGQMIVMKKYRDRKKSKKVF